MLNKTDCYNVLLKFWEGQLRFWEHKLKSDSDFDRQPAIEALTEMCQLSLEYNPLIPYPKEEDRLNPDDVKDFIKSRKLDIWGIECDNHKLGGKWD